MANCLRPPQSSAGKDHSNGMLLTPARAHAAPQDMGFINNVLGQLEVRRAAVRAEAAGQALTYMRHPHAARLAVPRDCVHRQLQRAHR